MHYDLPPVTRNLLLANVVIFLLQRATSLGPYLIAYAALWPLGPAHFAGYTASGTAVHVQFHIWEMITYAFLHGGVTHILFNMFALWMFGGPIEHLLGAKRYTFYYFVCAIVAGAAHLLVVQFFVPGFYPTIGASGAIFGLLIAFGVMFPHVKMFLLFLPIPMPAWVLVIGYILLELYLGVSGSADGIAHFAHLGGAAGGFALLQYWRGKLPLKPKQVLMR
jgi:membrane associated rhomboid family serine protease